MRIFKCKMCGGNLELNESMSVGTCQYCGTQQTLPRLDDDKKANLYDRANHFRRNNEYDKAMAIYEMILQEDREDAEAYWSLLLCKYGIEYVEDPRTHKRIPTCNRTQVTSIYADEDYKAAIKHADENAKFIYETEAKIIDSIQKGILDIAQKEEPFDVFICYKETESNGKRTLDSVLAQDLYYQLKQEGFKVFFSRITLEDRLGSAYEPYIYAALKSSIVMVVIGTQTEYFNAVWVKNEWSRYLLMIREGEKKVLIPAYKDMDPYDLPQEFSHLQAQDMSKLGFMQDLIRGIKKITHDGEEKKLSEQIMLGGNNNINTTSLLKRSFLCLEDGEFDKADEILEQVLNINPESSKAYVGKILVEIKLKEEEDLAKYDNPLTDNANYKKAIRFADEEYKEILENYNRTILERTENERKEKIVRMQNLYDKALKIKQDANSPEQYKKSAEIFELIPEFRDSVAQLDNCNSLINEYYQQELKNYKVLNYARVGIIFSLISFIIPLIIFHISGIVLCLIALELGIYNKSSKILTIGGLILGLFSLVIFVVKNY